MENDAGTVCFAEYHGVFQVQRKRTLLYGGIEKRENVNQANLPELWSRLLSVEWGLSLTKFNQFIWGRGVLSWHLGYTFKIICF